MLQRSQGLTLNGQPLTFRGYLKNFLILNFAPLAPQARDCSLGGNNNPLAGKSPPILGDLGGLYVANDTSQTTS